MSYYLMEWLDLRKRRSENTQTVPMEPCDNEIPVIEFRDTHEISQPSPEAISRVTCSDENVIPNDTQSIHSPNDSVICVDQIDTDQVNSPHITPPHFSDEEDAPLALLLNNTEISATNDATENSELEDDFCIVFEKIAPPSEVQIIHTVEARPIPPPNEEEERHIQQLIANMTTRQYPNRNPSGAIIVHPTVSSSTSSDSFLINNDGDDDLINDDEDDDCVAIKVIEPVKRNLEKLDLSDYKEVESKKKRKIECGVCFDGPDEISNNGRILISTVCGHIFCNYCIKRAIASAKQCPKCRKKLTCKQYHPLYI